MSGIEQGLSFMIDQAFLELGTANVSFMFKLFMLFGAFYLLNMVFKTSGSLIEMLIYVVGFFKWLIYKIIGKDV